MEVVAFFKIKLVKRFRDVYAWDNIIIAVFDCSFYVVCYSYGKWYMNGKHGF